MQSVGTRLREARIKKGYTLEDINARTRISLKNLNAIESDDLTKISSPFTYRSFVKQIADIIGVDHHTSLVEDAKAASSTMPEPLVPGQEEEVFVRPHQFQPVKLKRNMTWVYRTASIAAIAGVVSGYLIWRNGGTKAANIPTDFLPASSRVLAPVSEPQPEPIRADQVAKTVVLAPVAANVEPPAVQAPPPPGTEQLLPPASESSANVSASTVQVKTVVQTSTVTVPALSEAEANNIHIELSAIEPTWLSIVADGKTTYTGVLAAMETKVFDGRDTARIRTVNAGGVNIIFNGRALGPLGRHGQSRTFVFTRSGYEVVQGAASNATDNRLSPSGE
jgi:cytoskeletal protein RodZ